MSNNPSKYEVLIEQYLCSILDISELRESLYHLNCCRGVFFPLIWCLRTFSPLIAILSNLLFLLLFVSSNQDIQLYAIALINSLFMRTANKRVSLYHTIQCLFMSYKTCDFVTVFVTFIPFLNGLYRTLNQTVKVSALVGITAVNLICS